jgi:hypothetical protein
MDQLLDGQCREIVFNNKFTGLVVLLEFKLPDQPVDLITIRGSLTQLGWLVVQLGFKQALPVEEINHVLGGLPNLLASVSKEVLIAKLKEKLSEA